MTKISKLTGSLEGQKWTYSRAFSSSSVFGISWIFLENNRFIGEDYYSGGMHWNRPLRGTYYYDAEYKTVFLKYDKDKALMLKDAIKQQLTLKTIENDSTLIITNGWKKLKELSILGHSALKLSYDKIIGGNKFKIENINERIQKMTKKLPLTRVCQERG